MTALHTKNIIDEFADTVDQEVDAVIAKMAGLMRQTIIASRGVTVPDDMVTDGIYDELQGGIFRTEGQLVINHGEGLSAEEKLHVAATLLFWGFD